MIVKVAATAIKRRSESGYFNMWVASFLVKEGEVVRSKPAEILRSEGFVVGETDSFGGDVSIQPEYVGGSVVSEVDYRIWAHSGTRCGIERWAEDPFGEFDQAVFDEVIVVEVGGIAESDGG